MATYILYYIFYNNSQAFLQQLFPIFRKLNSVFVLIEISMGLFFVQKFKQKRKYKSVEIFIRTMKRF